MLVFRKAMLTEINIDDVLKICHHKLILNSEICNAIKYVLSEIDWISYQKTLVDYYSILFK